MVHPRVDIVLDRVTPSVEEKIRQIWHDFRQNLYESYCVPEAEKDLAFPDCWVLFDEWEELLIPQFYLVGFSDLYWLEFEAGLPL